MHSNIMTDAGFVEGQSDNLPLVDSYMIAGFFPDSDVFTLPEVQGVKFEKLHGSYEALKGGSTCEALEDFTGGVTEMYELDASPPNLFQIVLKAYERSSLMGASIEPDPYVMEARTPEGLIRGHAYSITRVKYVNIETPNVSGKIPLLRLRNPWGNENEWNGAWSDGAPEWRYISDEEKEDLGLTFDEDGEFWISFKDFVTNFSRLEICNLNPDSLSEEELQNKKKWAVSFFEGQWVRGVSAGGCRNFLETFWQNPQYRITLTEVDDGDDDQKCTLIVALMQKNRRQKRTVGLDLLTIGFAIYYLPYPDRAPKPLDLSFFKYNASVARSPSFINLREVSCRFRLPAGTYCIIPSTFDPDEEGEFLLRVFSEKQATVENYGSYSNTHDGSGYNNSYQPFNPNYSGYPYPSNQNRDYSPYNYNTQASAPYPTNPQMPVPQTYSAPPQYPYGAAAQPPYSNPPQPPYNAPSHPPYTPPPLPQYNAYPPQSPVYPTQPGYSYPAAPQPRYESRESDGPVKSFFKQFFNK